MPKFAVTTYVKAKAKAKEISKKYFVKSLMKGNGFAVKKEANYLNSSSPGGVEFYKKIALHG